MTTTQTKTTERALKLGDVYVEKQTDYSDFYPPVTWWAVIIHGSRTDARYPDRREAYQAAAALRRCRFSEVQS